MKTLRMFAASAAIILACFAAVYAFANDFKPDWKVECFFALGVINSISIYHKASEEG